MTAKLITTFSPVKEIGGRIELARKVKELRCAGADVIHYRRYPGPHFFRCAVGAEYVTLWLEG